MDLRAWRRRLREYDEITNVGPIIRRYLDKHLRRGRSAATVADRVAECIRADELRHGCVNDGGCAKNYRTTVGAGRTDGVDGERVVIRITRACHELERIQHHLRVLSRFCRDRAGGGEPIRNQHNDGTRHCAAAAGTHHR